MSSTSTAARPRSHRPEDDRDLAVTWPLLGAEQQAWLREAVVGLYPDHDWLEPMT